LTIKETKRKWYNYQRITPKNKNKQSEKL